MQLKRIAKNLSKKAIYFISVLHNYVFACNGQNLKLEVCH